MDIGASSYRTPTKEDLSNTASSRIALKFASQMALRWKQSGKERLFFCCKDGTTVTMQEVLHIPALDRQLYLFLKIAQHGLKVRFGAKYSGIYMGNDLIKSVYVKKVFTHST